MITIVVKELDSNAISQLVKDLKKEGYQIGKDFDFEYSPGKFDWSTQEQIVRQTKFTFYNAKLATWFALRWS